MHRQKSEINKLDSTRPQNKIFVIIVAVLECNRRWFVVAIRTRHVFSLFSSIIFSLLLSIPLVRNKKKWRGEKKSRENKRGLDEGSCQLSCFLRN